MEIPISYFFGMVCQAGRFSDSLEYLRDIGKGFCRWDYGIKRNHGGRILKRNLLMGSNGEEVIAVIPYETADIEMLLREIETAAAFFKHRNTIRYRLERISSIIQQDLYDRLVDAEFIMAFMIKKYLSSIEHMDAMLFEQ